MSWDDLFVGRRFRSVSYGQGWLFPLDLRGMLPAGHLCWQVLGAVGELDLSGLSGRYRDDGQGEAPYDPVMMTALLFYCLLKGIRSVRAIAGACTDDLGAVVICGGQRPHYSTVSRFFTRHRAALKGLFVQVLGLCAAEGLVDAAVAAVDGSPVSANAARSSNADAGRLAEQAAVLQAQVEAEVEALFAEVERSGTGQPRLEGWQDAGGDDGDDLPPGPGNRPLAAKIARLGRLRHAQQVLAARAAAARSAEARAGAAEARAAAAGDRLAQVTSALQTRADADAAARAQAAAAGRPARRGPKVVPPQQSKTLARQRAAAEAARARADAARAEAVKDPVQVSATDPDSRLIPGKNGGYQQAWNLQVTAVRRQILLAVGLHDSPNDREALIPAVTDAAANCAAAGLTGPIAAWIADNGYASAASFQALDHLTLLVAVCKDAIQAGRQDSGTAIPALWQDMAARLDTPEGKALYKRRSPTVEPAFAQLFARFGRYISRRGYDAAATEATLLGTAHNLAKLLAHRRRQARTPRPAATATPAPAAA